MDKSENRTKVQEHTAADIIQEVVSTESEDTQGVVASNDPHLNYDNNDSQIEIWKSIIAELCVKAPGSAVKECLRIYDPSKPTAQIKTMLKKCSKEQLQYTLRFLKGTLTEKRTKDEIIDRIILRVKNLFPDVYM